MTDPNIPSFAIPSGQRAQQQPPQQPQPQQPQPQFHPQQQHPPPPQQQHQQQYGGYHPQYQQPPAGGAYYPQQQQQPPPPQQYQQQQHPPPPPQQPHQFVPQPTIVAVPPPQSAPHSGGMPSATPPPPHSVTPPPQQQQQPQQAPASGGGPRLPPSRQNSQQQQQQHPRPAVPVKSTPSRKKKKKTQSLEDDVLVTRTPDEETQDGRIRNREASAKIRDMWIYKQVRLRQREFTQFRQATVFTGTWNVNAKGKEEPLDDWLCADWGPPSGEQAPDVVAVGFQEIVDLNAVNVAVDNKTQQRSLFWVERLRDCLNRRGSRGGQQYVLLASRSMVGLLVVVFCKAVHQQRVRHVSTASVGVGVMGMMGNKGGVSVRLQFYDSTFCFVCTHLAAHRENVTGRNADFANVFSKTSFEIGEEAIREVIRSGSLSHWAIGSSTVGIEDHDVVFWIGDLNYRIDESMMTEKVLNLSEKGILDELRYLDQLNVERAAGRVFEGFEEGALNFPPTYKYQPGTDIYEQRPDKKLRAPAWCDRILWMAQEVEHVQQFTYNRSERPNCSDHKPVYSTLRVTIKDVIQAKREAIYTELMKLLDRFENQTLPMVGLDRINLDFGEVRYGQSITLPIQITNTGSVVAQFRLVPKLDEKNVCKPWLKISPAYGMLIPGEKPICMNCTITIDKITAQMLNSGRELLDDILILRLENGRDYYVTVNATYARSCFGMSAEELVMYSDPIRNIPLDAIKRSEVIDPNTTTAMCVPKELWRIVDALAEKGLGEPHLFVEPGIPEEVEQIRECVDTGERFGQYHIHSYAEALVSFLESLSSPIVPSVLFPSIEIDSMTIQSSSRAILEGLAPVCYNIFVYVISFFREVLLYRERNLLSAAKVARICCNCMAPGTELDNSSSAVQRRTSMQLIMLHLLETNSI